MINSNGNSNAKLLSMHLKTPLNTTSLFHIVLTRGLVLANEVSGCIPRNPVCDLGELLPKTIDRLLIHVGLCNELWEGDYTRLDRSGLKAMYTYLEDGTGVRHHRYHQLSFQQTQACSTPIGRGLRETDYAQNYDTVRKHSEDVTCNYR
jgi:hypothetical protein